MKMSTTRLAGVAAMTLLLASAPAPAAAPVGRYTVSGGVVKDSKTGLYWQQATASMTYTYADAMTYCSGNVPSLPGSGWRLPAIKELQTLVDDSVALPNPTIDANTFPATPANYFWSSTPLGAPPALNAWLVYFYNGATFNDPVTFMGYVRCVR